MKSIRIIDSHTGGEPTRVVIEGGPDLGQGSMMECRERFASEYDHYRSAVINEPRGSEVLVGALLCEPRNQECTAGVIFFNNVGMLGMCGHGTIGLIVTLAHLNRIRPGIHRLETPVGEVEAKLGEAGSVTLSNVSSFRQAKNIQPRVPGFKKIHGDVAWGGNWFFLCGDHELELTLENQPELTRVAELIRDSVHQAGFPEVDHVELIGKAVSSEADARNFVLCPGGAFDRSPCGTGTSAKLACLAAEGGLKPGQRWVQESITGSMFTAWYEIDPEQKGSVLPSLTGTAFITGETTLLIDEKDPLGWGFGTLH